MKLLLAIISNDDSSAVQSALTKNGFQVTKLATTGGFLMAGNTTFISGVQDDKVDEAIEIIGKHSSKRTQIVPSASTMDVGMYSSFPVEVTVGGATIFVLNVDRFEKL
ncbi:MAG: cyclic-di-AMP receptor [Clostridia bacterium]|nr:cyclic-di-AMP receptor [Clostridia bacterium]